MSASHPHTIAFCSGKKLHFDLALPQKLHRCNEPFWMRMLTQVCVSGLSVSLCRCVTAVSAGSQTLTAAHSANSRTTAIARASAPRGMNTSRNALPLESLEKLPMRTCGESSHVSYQFVCQELSRASEGPSELVMIKKCW